MHVIYFCQKSKKKVMGLIACLSANGVHIQRVLRQATETFIISPVLPPPPPPVVFCRRMCKLKKTFISGGGGIMVEQGKFSCVLFSLKGGCQGQCLIYFTIFIVIFNLNEKRDASLFFLLFYIHSAHETITKMHKNKNSSQNASHL